MADLTLRLDPQMPPTKLGYLMSAYFFGRKFERVIELSDQIPEESRSNSIDSFGPQAMPFSAAPRTRSAPKPTSSPKTANR